MDCIYIKEVSSEETIDIIYVIVTFKGMSPLFTLENNILVEILSIIAVQIMALHCEAKMLIVKIIWQC